MTKRAVSPLRPSIVGTGLVALDIVVKSKSTDSPRFYSGGTCGNVLTALSYISWHAQPIARLAPGTATSRLLGDLRSQGVSTEFISTEKSGSTPTIIHRITSGANGIPRHSFSWRCPLCGTHLPGYKPLLASAAVELTHAVEKAQVFFFDRVSRGALLLAKAAADSGAVIVFEPSGVGDPKLFQEAWALSHFVKYSHERLRDIADLDFSPAERNHVLLEVETLGNEGLRYRSRLPQCPSKGWQRVGAFEPLVFKDAGGAGDWCTAGIVDRLGRGGLKSFQRTSKGKLQEALNYGQALAAWNCGFEGARGGMYAVDEPTFKRQVQSILKRKKEHLPEPGLHDTSIHQALGSLCPRCNGTQHGNIGIGGHKRRPRKSG